MALIPVAQFLPDDPDLMAGSKGIANAIPAVGPSYRPFHAPIAQSQTPLTARCQGAFYTRDSSSNAVQVAGDVSKLYKLAALAWADVSRLAGGAYACPIEGQWKYTQFGPLLLAVDGADKLQTFNVDSSTNFIDGAGSPPVGAAYCATMGDFAVLAGTPTGRTTVTWSAINNAADYVASAVTQADSQIIPSGGFITGLVGYEYGGLVLQERSLRRMDYEGSPIIFRFKVIAQDVGAQLAGSVAAFGDRVFFVHRSGFYMVTVATQLTSIGSGKVDRMFWEDPNDGIDPLYIYRCSSAIDPVNKLYGILYSAPGSSGVQNRILVYHWETGWWTIIRPGNLEYLFSGTAQNAITLDSLVGQLVDSTFLPVDSAIWTGNPLPIFGAFDTAHNIAYFNGPTLAPQIDTIEAQLVPGRRSLLRSIRPIINFLPGTTVSVPSVVIGGRNRTQDDVTYSAAQAADQFGNCRFREAWRYHRARLSIPAASGWGFIQGVDEIVVDPWGNR